MKQSSKQPNTAIGDQASAATSSLVDEGKQPVLGKTPCHNPPCPFAGAPPSPPRPQQALGYQLSHPKALLTSAETNCWQDTWRLVKIDRYKEQGAIKDTHFTAGLSSVQALM